jgi:hypothetical protein
VLLILWALSWDLVLIEGWANTVPAFIAEIRRRNPFAVVVYMCFDVSPSVARILRLDVDGFITNSVELSQWVLPRFAPTRFMNLAVDTERIHRVAAVEKYQYGL